MLIVPMMFKKKFIQINYIYPLFPIAVYSGIYKISLFIQGFIKSKKNSWPFQLFRRIAGALPGIVKEDEKAEPGKY